VTARRGRPPKSLLDLRPAEFRRALLAEAQAELAAELRGDDPPLPRLDRSARRRNDEPVKLTTRHAELIAMIVSGEDAYIAAARLGLQRRFVRRLLKSPIFISALEARSIVLSERCEPPRTTAVHGEPPRLSH
jgi:hypothetical protein